jgi:hypothetical protein
MKLETHLQPNCSESVVAVVDWENKQVIDSYETSSDGKDEDSVTDEVKAFVDYIKKGYEVNINSNGDNYTPAIYNVAEYICTHKVKVINWTGLAQAIGDETVIHDKTKIWDYADKLDRFAKGGFKNADKKRAANNSTAV